MRERSEKILKVILDKGSIKLQELIEMFGISKRTLYYNIEDINYDIKDCGEVKSINHVFSFVGDYDKLYKKMFIAGDNFINIENRNIRFLMKKNSLLNL